MDITSPAILAPSFSVTFPNSATTCPVTSASIFHIAENSDDMAIHPAFDRDIAKGSYHVPPDRPGHFRILEDPYLIAAFRSLHICLLSGPERPVNVKTARIAGTPPVFSFSFLPVCVPT